MCQRAASALVWLCADSLLFQVLLLSVLVIAWLQSSPCVNWSLPGTVSAPLVLHQPLGSVFLNPSLLLILYDGCKGMGVEGQNALPVQKLLGLVILPLSCASSIFPLSLAPSFIPAPFHFGDLFSAFLSCPDPNCQGDGCFTMSLKFTGVSLEHVIW